MKNKLPPFIEIYRALIATPSISATEEALDQSNADLITLLADWFKDLGFNVEVQSVPGTRNKFNTEILSAGLSDLFSGRSNLIC